MNGLHQITRPEYDAIQAEHFSRLKSFAHAPALYQAYEEARKETDDLVTGIVTDLLVFDGPKGLDKCAIFTGKVRNGEKWESFKAENAGKHLLTQNMAEESLSLAGAVRTDKVAQQYLVKGDAKLSVVWECKGFKIKSELDFLSDHNDMILDLKTTKDASPAGFGRQVIAYEYLAQAAMYVDGLAAAIGMVHPFMFVAVEKTKPYLVGCYCVTDEQIELGRQKYLGWLDALAYCQKEGRFPGYGTEEMDLVVPKWAMREEED